MCGYLGKNENIYNELPSLGTNGPSMRNYYRDKVWRQHRLLTSVDMSIASKAISIL